MLGNSSAKFYTLYLDSGTPPSPCVSAFHRCSPAEFQKVCSPAQSARKKKWEKAGSESYRAAIFVVKINKWCFILLCLPLFCQLNCLVGNVFCSFEEANQDHWHKWRSTTYITSEVHLSQQPNFNKRQAVFYFSVTVVTGDPTEVGCNSLWNIYKQSIMCFLH